MAEPYKYDPNKPLINQQAESTITTPAPPNYVTFAIGGSQQQSQQQPPSPEVHHHEDGENDLAEVARISVDHMNVSQGLAM